MSRRIWRSSLLGHPNAKFFEETGQELRSREKMRLGKPLRFTSRINGLGWASRGGGMSRAHRAESRKSRSCQSASQIVIWIAMLTRENWTAQAEDGFHLSWRYVHGQQFSGEPQIDDAPVEVRKTILNMPTLHPAAINACGSLHRHYRFLLDRRGRMDSMRGGGGMLCDELHGRSEQILGGAGQDGTGFDDSDPRRRTGCGTALELLIREARQSSQVAPVGAGQVASVGVSQLFTDDRGYGRLHGCSADTNPSLEMTRAGLDHHTRLMATGSHPRQHIGGGVIQVKQNIAGIVILGKREKIDVKALKVACAQEAQYRSPQQLTCIPHPFAWARLSRQAMDQANEIELIWHRRQLAADCMRGDEESAIRHGHENAAAPPRAYNGFSLNGNNPLNFVSHSKGAPHIAPLPLHPIPQSADFHRSVEIPLLWKFTLRNLPA